MLKLSSVDFCSASSDEPATVASVRTEPAVRTWLELLADKKKTLSERNIDAPADVVLREVWLDEQLAAFPREIASLRKDKHVSAESITRKCIPFLDSFGVMRTRSTFQTGDTDFDAPIILDASSRVGRAWLLWLHASNYHLGVAALMSHARTSHHLFHLRRVCRQICSDCLTCRQRYAKPIDPPKGMMPSFRTTGGAAFRFIGIDFLASVLSYSPLA